MNYKEIELEKLNHLLNIGHSLDEIEAMSEVEIEEHMMIPEDTYEDWNDERFAFEREAIMSK